MSSYNNASMNMQQLKAGRANLLLRLGEIEYKRAQMRMRMEMYDEEYINLLKSIEQTESDIHKASIADYDSSEPSSEETSHTSNDK